MRCVAALLVIYSHAFVLAIPSTDENRNWLATFSYSLAEYSVYVFFIISGVLLPRSLAANPNSIYYGVNRGLRILPGFIFYTIVTGFIIGPIFTSSSLHDYFADYQTHGFFRWGVDSLADTTLPGVFAYQGELSAVVNGSLWSLHYEALSYILLLTLWLATRRATPVASIFLLLSVLVIARMISPTD